MMYKFGFFDKDSLHTNARAKASHLDLIIICQESAVGCGQPCYSRLN